MEVSQELTVRSWAQMIEGYGAAGSVENLPTGRFLVGEIS
jgi:hypothetical protein